MKKWILSLLFIPTLCFGKGQEKTFPIVNFSKGVDTYHSPLVLPDGYVQDSLNVFFDKTAPIEKRTGFTVSFTSSNYAYTGLWHYTDPTSTAWLIARSSTSIIANNNLTTVIIATVSAGNIVNEVNSFGSAYFVDQTQGVYFWNGTSTTYVSGSPKGSLIEQFHGRVWVAGQAIPNGNILNGSKYLDGTTWSTGVNATDPVQFTIDLSDNYDTLTALYGSVNDTLYLFKNFSVSALYGFDQTDFQTRQLNREDGCVDSRSIQAYNKGLVLMGSKGVEFFDGYSFNRISDPIKNKVDGAIHTSFNQQSWGQSTQSDFQSGASSPSGNVSFNVIPGDVVLSTLAAVSFIDTSQADFTAVNTFVNLDRTTIPGSVILDKHSTNPPDITNESAITSNVNCLDGLSPNAMAQSFTSPSVPSLLSSVDLYLDRAGNSNCQPTVRIKNNNSDLPGSDLSVDGGANPSSPGFMTFYFSGANLAASTRYWIYIDGCDSSCASPESTVYWDGAAGDPYSGGTAWSSRAGLLSSIDFDFRAHLQGVSVYFSTGSYISQTFDVGFDTGTYLWNWGSFNTSETDNGQTITYETRVSTSPSGPWDDPVPVASLGSNIGSATKRYLQYISSFSTTDLSVSPRLDNVNMLTSVLKKPSGTYLSAVRNILNISSWGNFSADDVLNGGNLIYSIRASTNIFSVTDTTPSWTTQSNNSQITISTGTYVQIASSFSITAETQTPTLNDFNLSWFSGSKSPPMASAVYDNRYWLSLTTNTADAQNDGTIVLNTQGVWSILSIPSGAFTLSKGTLYHADSLGTGNVYQDDQGYNDNGTAIDSYVRTKDYSIDDWMHSDFFYELWIAADNNGPYNILTSYYVDGGITSYTLSSALENEMNGRLYLKLPIGIDSTHQNFSSTISFKFEESDNNAPWKFYGSYLNYRERPIQ